jgi:hypothetical protein
VKNRMRTVLVFALVSTYLFIGNMAFLFSQESKTDDQNLFEFHQSNLDKVPKPIASTITSKYPQLRLISVCEGKLTGLAKSEFATGLFNPVDYKISVHVFSLNGAKVTAFDDIAIGKSTFGNPVKNVTEYSAVQCFTPEDAKAISDMVHAGGIKSSEQFDTICFGVDDTGSDCYRFNSKKHAFESAGGWAN